MRRIIRRITPSKRKLKKEKLLCQNGPYHGLIILLTVPHGTSAVFRVGHWTGFYRKMSLGSTEAEWVSVSH